MKTIKNYSRQIVQENPNWLFVFGENQEQQGSNSIGGGQAVVRNLENTFGFCTLEAIGKYWSDESYPKNIVQIEKDIKDLSQKSSLYEEIVFPYYGLGTGRALMQKRCPKTFLYMCKRILEVFQFNNLENLISKPF